MLELCDVSLKPTARAFSHRFVDGQITVVLGRNNSGKTLLTRIIAGLDEPACGKLLLDGEDITGSSPGKRSVALVIQAFVNYPSWTVLQNIASPLLAKSKFGRINAGVRRQVEEIAERLELTDLLQRYPHSLSGGQQQRVAIGRALAKSARVLVMDEPLVNLDYKLRESLQMQLQDLLHQYGMSVIYTTSDPRDVFTLADSVLLMADDQVLQSGRPLQVYESPTSPGAADLMSDPFVNRLPGAAELQMIRPEHLQLEQQAADDAAFEVEVIGTETNGSETYLHCRAQGNHWVARLPGLVTLKSGSRCALYASADSVMKFASPETQETAVSGG